MRLAFDRFTVVLDACVLFPMTVRDVLLTLADHEFFNPKWSTRLHEEWGTNLVDRRQAAGLPGDVQAQVAATRQSMDRAFPDALVQEVLPETANVAPVDPKDRHVVMTAISARADAIVTFNLKDFAAPHLLKTFEIEVLHPDQFILDLIDLQEKRAVVAFKEMRARKQNPPWTVEALIERVRNSGLVQTAVWLEREDVRPLL